MWSILGLPQVTLSCFPSVLGRSLQAGLFQCRKEVLHKNSISPFCYFSRLYVSLIVHISTLFYIFRCVVIAMILLLEPIFYKRSCYADKYLTGVS